MNKVVLLGRLTRDPDVRYSQGAQPTCVARYTLAVNRRYKKEGEADADFISCVAFGKNGEFVEKYLRQGTKIVVAGRIQTGSYTNRDGVKVYTTDVVVEEHDFAESKAANESHAGAGYQATPAPVPSHDPEPQYKQQSFVGADGFMSIPEGYDEELPFI